MKLFKIEKQDTKIRVIILGIKISFKFQLLNPFKKPIFRNDDVSVDSNLEHFKEFCEVFHKYGYTQLHAINLYGYTNCNFLTGDLPTPYEGYKNLSTIENSELRKLSDGKFIGDNKELVDYINSIPDEIALHGLYHTNYSKMTYEEQYNDIKKGLRLLKELFPNKKVKVFVAPFNKTNEDTYKICKEFKLRVSAEEGDHLENMVHSNRDKIRNGMIYRYHHHRFYPESTFSYYDLSIEKLERYFKKGAKFNYQLPSIELIKEKVNKFDAQQWYIYAFQAFKERQHQYISYKWILKNIKKNKIILETGCGIGGSLYHLCNKKYKNLYGYDYDEKSINAGKEIADEINADIKFFIQDGKNPDLHKKFDVISAINWIYHVSNYSLDEFIKLHLKYLSSNGYFVFDVIDKSFNKIKNNEYSTSTWNKPISERRPSEYLERLSFEDIKKISEKYNLNIVYHEFIESSVPHVVYVLQNERPQICLLCDVPNWAFHNSAIEIVNQLSDEFCFDIKYVVDKPKIKPKDYDLLQVFFWGEEYYKKFKWPKDKIIKQVSSHRWQDNPMYGPLTPEEFYKKYLSDSKTIICPSKILYELLKDNCSNLYLCQKGYSPVKFFYSKERKGDFSICWAGNIKDPVKGVEEIIIPATKDKYNIDLASDLKHEELCEFYNNHDVYVVASRNEADPLPLIESMACGCFPVANYVGIAPEIIEHKKNGYLVQERTVEAYQEAFQWCKDNINFVRKAGRENAKLMFDIRRWEITAESYRKMYRSCLNREK